MRGPDGVIAGLKEGGVVIDFGTSLPASTRALGDVVAEVGGTYLDAPLGRTPSHGREGKLNIMCAGDKATYDRVKPVLDDLGENVFHLGPLGSGHTIKLINNFFAMTTANAMSEAFAMADVAGNRAPGALRCHVGGAAQIRHDGFHQGLCRRRRSAASWPLP